MFTANVWEAVRCRLGLSAREVRLVQCVFEDKAERQIARELRVAPSTIHSQFERLYLKLGVHSRAALVVRVVTERGCAAPPPDVH